MSPRTVEICARVRAMSESSDIRFCTRTAWGGASCRQTATQTDRHSQALRLAGAVHTPSQPFFVVNGWQAPNEYSTGCPWLWELRCQAAYDLHASIHTVHVHVRRPWEGCAGVMCNLTSLMVRLTLNPTFRTVCKPLCVMATQS